MKLSAELKAKIQECEPLIVFFSWPAKKQLENLPIIEKETKYDFPDGDLVTNNALEVLITSYTAFHNSIYIRLIIMLDESIDEDIQTLEGLFDQLLETSYEISETRFNENIENINIIQSSEWEKLRQLSRAVQQKLNIQSNVNAEILERFINARLHP